MEIGDQVLSDGEKLLESAFELLSRIHGRRISRDETHLNDAQTLSKKVVTHVETSLYLLKATPRNPDFASIAVLIRASYEAFLLLFYVFAMPEAKNERRHDRWKLKGMLQRKLASGLQDPRPKSEIQKEERRIAHLQARIEAIATPDGRIVVDGHEQTYSAKSWRYWKPGWSRLAELAGFDKNKFSAIYAYLCGYSHGDSWSLAQIDQAPRNQDERRLGLSLFMLAVPVLSELLDVYPRVMGTQAAIVPPEIGSRFTAYRTFLRSSSLSSDSS